MNWLKWLKNNIWKYPNVNGYSNVLHLREKNGVTLPQISIRVYVEKKVPESKLLKNEIIPKYLKFRTWSKFWKKQLLRIDIKEIGEAVKFVDKTAKWRPMELGVAVGHHDITAGSLGMLYESNNPSSLFPYVCGTNAHVATPDPSLPVGGFSEKRIYNPAPYHDPSKPEQNVVGEYLWHKQIKPIGDISDCEVSRFCTWFLNGLSKLFGRKTRFKTEVDNPLNYIDFAVYEPEVDHDLKIADNSINLKTVIGFIGHLFAGSDTIGIICKSKYIETEGWKPLINSCEVEKGDRVKGCSFWCNYETVVDDPSATVQVNYGTFLAIFTDVIFVKNEPDKIKGGWSGSSFLNI